MERVERSLRALATTDEKAVITARQVLDGVIAAYKTAVQNRPTHPSSHRLLAYAQLKAGRLGDAFRTISAAVEMEFAGRFRNAGQILQEDQAILASAWTRACPNTDVKAQMNSILNATSTQAAYQVLNHPNGGTPPTIRFVLNARAPNTDIMAEMNSILDAKHTSLADKVLNHPHARTPTLRFVLNWETDANDVDFHMYDSKGGHAYYGARNGAPPGVLYADVTQGWGPECFTIEQTAQNFPYRMEAHYYRSAGNVTVRMRACAKWCVDLIIYVCVRTYV